MKKIWQIWYVSDIGEGKHINQDFQSKESAHWYVINPKNYDIFRHNETYYVKEVYIKTPIKPEIKDGF